MYFVYTPCSQTVSQMLVATTSKIIQKFPSDLVCSYKSPWWSPKEQPFGNCWC